MYLNIGGNDEQIAFLWQSGAIERMVITFSSDYDCCYDCDDLVHETFFVQLYGLINMTITAKKMGQLEKVSKLIREDGYYLWNPSSVCVSLESDIRFLTMALDDILLPVEKEEVLTHFIYFFMNFMKVYSFYFKTTDDSSDSDSFHSFIDCPKAEQELLPLPVKCPTGSLLNEFLLITVVTQSYAALVILYLLFVHANTFL